MTLSRRIARAARALRYEDLPSEAIAKVKIALLDFFSCAFESLDLPWSKQAMEFASPRPYGRGLPGDRTSADGEDGGVSSASDVAFVNAILGHGLVREDMHTGSVSHLGVVVFPALIALAERRKCSGRDFILGAVCGYEAGASIGRALMDQENVRLHRPTGITGPVGGALAGSIMLGLSEDACVSALGLAANTTVGLNEWPHSGADDMFFHAGYAARNAVTAVELADLGARASETALDGRAGLFAALRRPDCARAVAPFSRKQLELMEVYHKPAPACNYAQTGCQAAAALKVNSSDIVSINVKCSAAALNYPGCNSSGPYGSILQAKMSIQFCVAATLASGAIQESNYRKLQDPEIMRLVSITTLEEDPAFTRAYPAMQGTEVSIEMRGGRTLQSRLNDLVPATPDQIRERFRQAAGNRAQDIEVIVNNLESCDHVKDLAI